MNKLLLSMSVVIVSSLFLISCDKVPEQELSTAKAALDSAKTAEADKYVATEFQAAQDTLNAAIAEIEKQKSGSILTTKYDKARQLLSSATTAARSLVSEAQEQKSKVQAEADTSLNKVTSLATETKDLVAKLPKAKKTLQDSLTTVLATIDTSITLAQKAKTDGNLVDARDKANAEITKLDSLKTTLASLPAPAAVVKTKATKASTAKK